ncbi:soluble lamin-associated protein of 75 kDa isoform X2 [Colius striatus]|nr:soluble lamin-associated protein of 75 kDa isoform X2 [Colius striatus]
MEGNEIPFLCHGSNEYAKIMWKDGEAIGFYSVKPKGSVCSSYDGVHYRLPVLNTIFVRKKHRGKDSGLIILEDFVESFAEGPLGLRYPLSPFMYTACKQYLEKYPEDHNLLWEVQGAGYWFQRKSVAYILQMEKLKMAVTAAESSQKENENSQVKDHVQQSATVSEASEQKTELETQPNADSQNSKESADVHASTSEDSNIAPASVWTRNSHLRRLKLGKYRLESEPQTPQRHEESALHMSKRPDFSPHTCDDYKDLEVPQDDTVLMDEEISTEDNNLAVLEMEVHVPRYEKQSEKEEAPSEPLNGEVREETAKTSLMTEEETANKALSDEPKLQSESQGEEPVTLIVPLILESPAKSSEDTALEKVLNVNDSEVLTEESTSVEKGTEGQQDSEKKTTENAAASAQKEEPSDNGLPNSTVTEAAEESVSENVSSKTASSSEDQNEDTGHNSHETPVPLSQSSLIMVELEGVSFQVPPGQEGQKNQVEEQSKESEQTQTSTEWAADSSSEEAEVEVPIIDRRNLRRKAKGYKGPPKKKGKPA